MLSTRKPGVAWSSGEKTPDVIPLPPADNETLTVVRRRRSLLDRELETKVRHL